MYLCYDIKGIQQFIFSVPRLRYMIGGSGQISQFDERWKEPANLPIGVERIFTGGGRGGFRCENQGHADALKKSLIELAHRDGFDVRIGIDERFDFAMQRADELYPYLPSPNELAGLPCSESGLYPVAKNSSSNRNNNQVAIHPLIRRRGELARKDPLGRLILDRIEAPLFERLGERFSIEFIRNVSPELRSGDGDDAVSRELITEDIRVATAGQVALGKRNRWAVIAMDGNAIGKHFKKLLAEEESGNAHILRKVSDAIQQITERAFDAALIRILVEWFDANKASLSECTYDSADSSHKRLVVPVRPILLGGDDLILLCHCGHAMDFVETMTENFELISRDLGGKLQRDLGFNPWADNGGVLTISAGVLFAKTSLPLHVAIPYAESLLGSAKGAIRFLENTDQVTPSAIDWEIVTDTMLDHPATRRKRDLRFWDRDIGTVIQLTRRPYQTLKSIGASGRPSLKQLREETVPLLKCVPRSSRSELERSMLLPWAQRSAFLLAMAKDKRHRQLAEQLDISPNNDKLPARWFQCDADSASDDPDILHLETDVIDALGIMNEQHRQSQTTVQR